MKTAFTYITMLKHEDKPNYNLIKLWLTFSREDEKRAFSSKLVIRNERIASDVLYENQNRIRKINIGEERKEVIQKNDNAEDIDEFDDDFRFDLDTDENLHIGNSLEKNFKKVDNEAIHKQKVRDFILNH